MNRLIEILGQIHPSLSTLRDGPLWIFLIVIALTIIFFVGYIFKGSQVGWQLYTAVRGVQALRRPNNSPNPAEVAKILPWQPLKHLWDEYSDTLHELRK